ncbi:MAG: hypothetical protein IJZ93_05785 [Clostridia bacterium]|nr:hypothetical protein [Clostridia bacterium]
MKKIISFIIIIASLFTLCSCKKELTAERVKENLTEAGYLVNVIETEKDCDNAKATIEIMMSLKLEGKINGVVSATAGEKQVELVIFELESDAKKYYDILMKTGSEAQIANTEIHESMVFMANNRESLEIAKK